MLCNMKGKCNCGKKATSEYLSRDKKGATTIKFCAKHNPKRNTEKLYLIDGK